ncbi:MAG: Smr/MutS family protein [Gallionella sp.]
MAKPPSRKTGQVEPDDAELFRASVGKVKPLTKQNRAELQKPPQRPRLQDTASTAEVPDILSDFVTGETPEKYLANGLSVMTLRKLRRGEWPVKDSLDLHGLNTDAARKLLQEFLHNAVQRQFRCVLVIHGKGVNSERGEAVLRKLTRNWLTQHASVLGFCDATPRLGGSGAVLVLLRSSR